MKKRGIGLIGAIFVLLVIGLLTLALTRGVATGAELRGLENLSTRAYLAAESGAQLAVQSALPRTGAPVCTAQTYTLNALGYRNCTAAVTCTQISAGGENFFAIESRGQCVADAMLTAERVVEVVVR